MVSIRGRADGRFSVVNVVADDREQRLGCYKKGTGFPDHKPGYGANIIAGSPPIAASIASAVGSLAKMSVRVFQRS